MPESVYRGDAWWHQGPDGTWMRWNDRARAWEPQDIPPPPLVVEAYRPLRMKRTWTVWLLGIGVVVDVVAAIFRGLEYALLQAASRGEAITLAQGEASDQRISVISGVRSLMILAAGVAFIVWFHTAYRNLRPLGATGLRYATGWAIGGWFVPIMNLWRPKQIANDIWRASDPEAPPDQSVDWRFRPVGSTVNWWWGLWIASSLVSLTVISEALNPETIEDFLAISLAALASNVLAIGAGILAIMVVNQLSDRLEARHARLMADRPIP